MFNFSERLREKLDALVRRRRENSLTSDSVMPQDAQPSSEHLPLPWKDATRRSLWELPPQVRDNLLYSRDLEGLTGGMPEARLRGESPSGQGSAEERRYYADAALPRASFIRDIDASPIHPPIHLGSIPALTVLVLAATYDDYRNYCVSTEGRNGIQARFPNHALNLVHCTRLTDLDGRTHAGTRYVLANRYWELDPELLERVRLRLESIFDADAALITKGNPVMPFTCANCKHYFGQTHHGNTLNCAMHPYGPEAETCPDHESR